jgi:hypothetical protein
MKPDKALIKHLLSILHRIGPAGIEESALATELEVAAGRPLTTAQARDALVWSTDRGYVATRRDDFEQTVAWLTDSGKTILSGM